MQLPPDAGTKAKKFAGLSEERKAALIAHIAQSPAPKVVETIIANGGPEGSFIAFIFDRAPETAPIKAAAAKPAAAPVNPPDQK